MDFEARYEEIDVQEARRREQKLRAAAQRHRQMCSEIDSLAEGLAAASTRLALHDVPVIPMVSRDTGRFGRAKPVHRAGVWSFFDLLYLDADANLYLPEENAEPIAGRARGKRNAVVDHTDPIELSRHNVTCDESFPTPVVALIAPDRRTRMRVNNAGNILYRHRKTAQSLETVNQFVAAWVFQQIRWRELT